MKLNFLLNLSSIHSHVTLSTGLWKNIFTSWVTFTLQSSYLSVICDFLGLAPTVSCLQLFQQMSIYHHNAFSVTSFIQAFESTWEFDFILAEFFRLVLPYKQKLSSWGTNVGSGTRTSDLTLSKFKSTSPTTKESAPLWNDLQSFCVEGLLCPMGRFKYSDFSSSNTR